MTSTLRAFALCVTAVAGACGGPERPAQATSEALARVAPSLDGTYHLTSTLAVEAGALVPTRAGAALAALADLRAHPAHTLIALAEEGGVPAVGTLRGALPGALASRLEGWIDARIAATPTGAGTLPDVIDGVLAVWRTEVSSIGLGSRLRIAPGGSRHRLDTVALVVGGRSQTVEVAPLVGVGAVLDVPVVVTTGERGHLALGAHAFALPYGAIAWRAAEDLVTARYGHDLRGALGAQLDCDGLAAAVASRCALRVCVGHADELARDLRGRAGPPRRAAARRRGGRDGRADRAGRRRGGRDRGAGRADGGGALDRAARSRRGTAAGARVVHRRPRVIPASSIRAEVL